MNNKINLDSLYTRSREKHMNRIQIYEKILEKIHKRIKVTARQQEKEQYCFYAVPEFLLGIPTYNVTMCIEYIIEKLFENGFHVKYTHPNLIFISWQHYIPFYERQEYKKKTGIQIDGFGKQLQEKKIEAKRNNIKLPTSILKKQNTFKDISTYKPTNKLIYSNHLIKKITTKIE